MGIMAILKSNGVIRNIGKKIKIYREFQNDAKEFANSFLESAEKAGDYRYRIMLIVHSLEKGMCMPSPRPYGQNKVTQLMDILSKAETDKSSFEYILGISVLYAWKKFFHDHNWQADKKYSKVEAFLDNNQINYVKAGYQDFKNPTKQFDQKNFERVLLSRHSVRDFREDDLNKEDIDFAVKCFIDAPTACNRQMCRLIYIKDLEIKELLDRVIIGIPGINKKTVHYFIVTYDMAAFDYSGERQQGLFNAGLCTMNFVNGLHVRGIGSCCLQWSNKHSEDIFIRKKLMLSKSERIGIVVGAGYYLESSKIPCSVRRSLTDVYREI